MVMVRIRVRKSEKWVVDEFHEGTQERGISNSGGRAGRSVTIYSCSLSTTVVIVSLGKILTQLASCEHV